MRYATFALAALLALSGCTHEGQVTEKTYTPAYMVMRPCGKGMVCPTYIPECWGITLDRDNSICIDKATWDATPVGSYYTDHKPGGAR